MEPVLDILFFLFLLGWFFAALARLAAWYKKCRPSRRFLLTNLLPGLALAVAVTAGYTAVSWRIMAEQRALPVHTVTGQVEGLEYQHVPGHYSSFNMYYIRLEGDPNRYHALFLERTSEEFLAVAGDGPVTIWYTGEGHTREARAVRLADGTFYHTMEQSEAHDVERDWAGARVSFALFIGLSTLALGRPKKEWSRPEAERRARREGNRYLLRVLLFAAVATIVLFSLFGIFLMPKPVFYPACRVSRPASLRHSAVVNDQQYQTQRTYYAKQRIDQIDQVSKSHERGQPGTAREQEETSFFVRYEKRLCCQQFICAGEKTGKRGAQHGQQK